MAHDPAVWRILDANLNRAAEGLRVAEDWLRLGQDDSCLAAQCKELRHRLGEISQSLPAADLWQARNSAQDVGRYIKSSDELTRRDALQVVQAAWKRSQQSLRSLEEFGKIVDPQLGHQFECLRDDLYTLEKAWHAIGWARQELADIRLCVLLDERESASAFVAKATQLIDADVPMIQLRCKTLGDREWLDRAKSLRTLTSSTRTRMIVNDRADIAAWVGADGVHLGQDDLSVAAARRCVGQTCWIGVSTHNMEQAKRAVSDGATYLGVGPTFSSATKEFTSLAGLEFLRQVAAEIPLPAFAIGGITLAELPAVLATGVERVAVQNAVVNSVNPTEATREFLAQLAASPCLANRLPH